MGTATPDMRGLRPHTVPYGARSTPTHTWMTLPQSPPLAVDLVVNPEARLELSHWGAGAPLDRLVRVFGETFIILRDGVALPYLILKNPRVLDEVEVHFNSPSLFAARPYADSFISTPVALTFNEWAAGKMEPDPQNGSSTASPGRHVRER